MKRIISLLFAAIMLCGGVSVSATPAAKYNNAQIHISGVLDNADTNKNLTVLLLDKNANPDDFEKADLWYINQFSADENGKYTCLFKCPDGLEPDAVKLFVRAGSEDVTDTVVKSELSYDELFSYEIKVEQTVESGTAVADINQIFGTQEDYTGSFMPIIAFYDDDGRLLKAIAGEQGQERISAMKPEGTRKIKAFLWKNVTQMIPLCTPDSQPQKENMNVLIIGNSFSMDGSQYVKQVAAAAGVELNVSRIVHSGSSIANHWEKREENYFNYYPSSGGVVSEVPLSYAFGLGTTWDYVVLQNWNSKTMGNYDTNWQPYMNQVAGYVKEHCPTATLALQMTWAFERGYGICAAADGKTDYERQNEMYQDIVYGNLQSSIDVGKYVWNEDGDTISVDGVPIKIIPSGYVMQYARNYKVGGVNKFDTTYDLDAFEKTRNMTEGTVLDATELMNSDELAQGKIRLNRDGFHASYYGRYLLACTWFESLTGRSCVGNTFMPDATDIDTAGITGTYIKAHYDALTSEEAQLIQNVVHEAMQEYRSNGLSY